MYFCVLHIYSLRHRCHIMQLEANPTTRSTYIVEGYYDRVFWGSVAKQSNLMKK